MEIMLNDDSLKRDNEKMFTEQRQMQVWEQEKEQMAQQFAQAETWKNQVFKVEQEKQQLAHQNAQAAQVHQQMQQQLAQQNALAAQAEQEKQQMAQQNAQAAQANQDMQQQLERWKSEALKSQKYQRENVEKNTAMETQLRIAQERLVSADGGDANLKKMMQDQIDEIQQLMVDKENQRHLQKQSDAKLAQLTAELEWRSMSPADQVRSAATRVFADEKGQTTTGEVPSSSQPQPKASAQASTVSPPKENPQEMIGGMSMPDFFAAPKSALPQSNFVADHLPRSFKEEGGNPTPKAPEKGVATPYVEAGLMSNQQNYKETDKCEIEDMPLPHVFRQWLTTQKKIVASGSGRPQEAFVWITKCQKAATWEELEDSEGFDTWDAKVAVGCSRICKGEFLRKI